MKIKTFIFSFACLFVLILTGCASTENLFNGRLFNGYDNYDRSIREFATYMIRETGGTYDGIWVVEPVHAEDGFAMRLDGRQVVFLKYNPKLKKMKKWLDYVDERGFLYIAAFKYPAVRNGCFVMLDYKGFKTETREKLLKAFYRF